MNHTFLIVIGVVLLWAAVMLSGCDEKRCKELVANELHPMFCP